MRLPDDIFDEIVLHAGSGYGPGAARPADQADERRREPRLCLEAAVAFTRYGSLASATRTAGLRDLSPGGVGLLLRDELVAPGELFVVHAPRGEEERKQKEKREKRERRGEQEVRLVTARRLHGKSASRRPLASASAALVPVSTASSRSGSMISRSTRKSVGDQGHRSRTSSSPSTTLSLGCAS